MQRLVGRSVLQAKLTINRPGDVYEQEADRMADAVMRMPEPGQRQERVRPLTSVPVVQRACACGKSGRETGQCEECKAQAKALQRSAAGSPRAAAAPSIVHDVLQSPGYPLDGATRGFMEGRFGRDFGGVRIHNDSRASESARAVEAVAYTVGNHVVFGQGKYAPSHDAGRRLLAHELTHVLQQGYSTALQENQDHARFGMRSRHSSEAPAKLSASSAQTSVSRFSSAPLEIQRVCGPVDIKKVLKASTVTCNPLNDGLFAAGTTFLKFDVNCDVMASATLASDWPTFAKTLTPTDTIEIHGYASTDGPADFNRDLACARALAMHKILTTADAKIGFAGIPAKNITDVVGHGPTTGTASDRRGVVIKVTKAPKPIPPPPKPPCPAVPTATPAACADRHKGYCDAKACFPANKWLDCVCTVSGQICDAIDAFELHFSTTPGKELAACLAVPPITSPGPVITKGLWFETVNKCIWGHWRAAFDAMHDPALPLPAAATPEWLAAITTCRSKGLSSSDCCKAHVTAEQGAIDRCLPYPSGTFGKLPTDVPGSSLCSSVVRKFAPGPSFSGDFGVLADRIAFGLKVCSC